MKYGLTEKKINLIREIFKNCPAVECVFIYGSRAKGNYKKTSDIDLAVRFSQKDSGELNKLRFEMDNLPILNGIDLIDEKNIETKNFKEEYGKTKKLFYQRKKPTG